MTRRSSLARELEPSRAAEAVREYSHSASGSAVPRRSAVIHRLHPLAADDPHARRDHLAALLLIAGAGALAAVLGIVVMAHLLDRGDVPNPAEVALATEGRAVYAVSCRTCHGANLQGGASSGAGPVPPPLDATGHAWLHSDADLFEMVKYGLADCGADASPTMPPLGSHLDDDTIRAALAYIKSTWPAPIRRVQSTMDSAPSNVAAATGRPICSRLCRPVLASTAASQTAASP
jgi:S-disulfanyl-L-cysteine oxidoreductase SoxD